MYFAARAATRSLWIRLQTASFVWRILTFSVMYSTSLWRQKGKLPKRQKGVNLQLKGVSFVSRQRLVEIFQVEYLSALMKLTKLWIYYEL